MCEVDEAARHSVASARHDELLQRLHRAEDALQATTKDYILGAHAEISHLPTLTLTRPACCSLTVLCLHRYLRLSCAAK